MSVQSHQTHRVFPKGMLSTLNLHIQMLEHHTEAGMRWGEVLPGKRGQCEPKQSTPLVCQCPVKPSSQLALRLTPYQYPAPSQHFWGSWVNMEYIPTWETFHSHSSEPEQKGDLCTRVCSSGGTEQEAGNRFSFGTQLNKCGSFSLSLLQQQVAGDAQTGWV